MRRLLWVALAVGAACSDVSKVEPGPTDSFYRPTGIGVYAGKLVVASSNADLLYDSATGGSVISVDPSTSPAPGRARWLAGLNIESFAAQLAILDPAQCVDGAGNPIGPYALVAVRGTDALYRVGLGADGALSCTGCTLDVSGSSFADAYAVGVACGGGLARVYVGYLRSVNAMDWITELDLAASPPTIRSNTWSTGSARGFAYDATRQRIYAAEAGQGIRYVDLAGGCRFDLDEIDGGCHPGMMALPAGLDPRAIALGPPPAPGENRRMYVLARVFDANAAGSNGIRVGDVDGVLLVTELVDGLAGDTQLHLVKPAISVGYGPIALAVLPARPGKRDVVAALTVDDPLVLLYDDDDDSQVVIARDVIGNPALGIAPTGHPWVGAQPFGLAVDPVVSAAGDARLYVGSYGENFVTPIDVPLADIRLTQVPPAGGFTHLTGGTP